MKTINKLLILLILLISVSGCSKKVEQPKRYDMYVFDLKLVDGSVIRDTTYLNHYFNWKFYIASYRGAYRLNSYYIDPKTKFDGIFIIREAVIDYKLIKKDTTYYNDRTK